MLRAIHLDPVTLLAPVSAAAPPLLQHETELSSMENAVDNSLIRLILA
jgi:hypothetical protein